MMRVIQNLLKKEVTYDIWLVQVMIVDFYLYINLLMHLACNVGNAFANPIKPVQYICSMLYMVLMLRIVAGGIHT